MFKSLNITKYWSCQVRKRERNRKYKNEKIVSIAWHHNILTEMFTITD